MRTTFKKFFFIISFVLGYFLSIAQDDPAMFGGCGIYLKRDATDPAKVNLVFNPSTNPAFNASFSTNFGYPDGFGFTHILTRTGFVSGYLTLLIPDPDVTANLAITINDGVAANGGTYIVYPQNVISYADANDGKTYSVLSFSFSQDYAVPAGDYNIQEVIDQAFTDVTYNKGTDYVIGSFTFSNLSADAPIRLLFSSNQADILYLNSYVALGPVTDAYDASNNAFHFNIWDGISPNTVRGYIGFYPTVDKLTIEDGVVTGDCNGYEVTSAGPNITAFQELPSLTTFLPVSFGNLKASISGSKMLISWNTLTESNSDHFNIELSKDGKHFEKAATVASKYADGNSNHSILYNITIPKGSTAAYLSLSLLLIIGIVLMAFNNKNCLMALCFLMIVGAGFGASSCNKQEAEISSFQNGDVYVRIAQVDKDGKVTYSKIFKAVNE